MPKRNFIEYALAETALQAEFTRRKRDIPEIEDDLSLAAEGYLAEFLSDPANNLPSYKIDSKFLAELDAEFKTKGILSQNLQPGPQIVQHIYNQPANSFEKTSQTQSEDKDEIDEESVSLEEWDYEITKALPDSAFAVGRKLAHHNLDGEVDREQFQIVLERVENFSGLASIPKAHAINHLRYHARILGVPEPRYAVPKSVAEWVRFYTKNSDFGEFDVQHFEPSLTNSDNVDKVDVGGEMALQVKQLSYSYEQLQRMVSSAVYNKFGYDTYLFATYADHAVITDYRDGKFSKIPYSIVDGDIEFGDAEDTEMEWKTLSNRPRLIRNGDGQVGWLSVSSNIYKDSYNQRFSRAALQEAVARMQKSGDYGDLRVEHHPFSSIGHCTFSKVMGDFLIEGGIFDSTTRAQKAIETLENDTDGEFKTSIGFLYDPERLNDKGVFEGGVGIFERSITKTPANTLTAISIADIGEIMEKSEIQSRLAAVIGNEEAKAIVDGTSKNKEAIMEALGLKSDSNLEVAFKNEEQGQKEGEKEEPKVEQVQQDSEPPEELDVIIDGKTIRVVREDVMEKATKDAQDSEPLLAAMRAMLQPLMEKVDSLEAKIAQKSETPKTDDAPTRDPRRAWTYRATENAPKADEQEQKEAKEMTSVNGQKENIWSNFPGGR